MKSPPDRLPPAIACFDETIGTSETNIEEAKALMAEAGYPEGGFELGMIYQGTSPEETATFQIMQAGAAELGITVAPDGDGVARQGRAVLSC